MAEPSEFDLLVAKAKESLGVYVGLVHHTDDGAYAVPPKHLLEKVLPAIEDDSLGDTVIVAPPGSIKTNTMIGACAWWLGQDPTRHVGYVCNTGPEAVKRSLAIRSVMEAEPMYRAIFPEVLPDKERGWAADNWYLARPNRMDKNPSLTAFGVGGGLGARLDYIILDDIADDENQKTDLQRSNVVKWLGETIKTRLRPPGSGKRGRVIMICTRWHEDDPAAYAIERGWNYVHIPALDEKGRSYWPEYFPQTYLACKDDEHNPTGQCCMKKELGTVGFNRQFMGVVYNEESSIFKRHWWHIASEDQIDEDLDLTRGLITVDTAGWDRNSKRGDFAVLAAWYEGWQDDQKVYLCDEVQRGRWSFNEVEQIAINMKQSHNVPILVEDVPWARPLIDRLQKTTAGVIPWKVQGRSKQNRAEAVTALVEAGQVWLRKAPWNDLFIEEHAAFPDGRHDDQVDTTSMALGYLWKRAGQKKVYRKQRPMRDWGRLSA